MFSSWSAVVVALVAATGQQPAEMHGEPRAQMQAAFAAAFSGRNKLPVEEGHDLAFYYLKPVNLYRFSDYYVLVTEELKPSAPHVATGAIALAYLRRASLGFQVLGVWPQAIDGSQFGEPPTWRIRKDLAEQPVIEAGSSYDGQGCHVTSEQLWELTPGEPTLLTGGVLVRYKNDGPMGDGKGVDGPNHLTGRVGPGHRGLDFYAYYTGSFTVTVRYVKIGSAYKSAYEPTMPGC